MNEVNIHCDNCDKLIGYMVIKEGAGNYIDVISCIECRKKVPQTLVTSCSTEDRKSLP